MRALIRMGLWALLLALGTVAGVSAASNNQVLVVMNGQTEVNRETYNFLMRNFRQMAPSLTLKATLSPASVKADNYAAVVVINSGLKSGIDPVLKSMIASYSNKGQIYLVNIIAGSTDVNIQRWAASSAPQGVDTLTAASAWSEGADKMTWVKVHQQWIQAIADGIKKAN